MVGDRRDRADVHLACHPLGDLDGEPDIVDLGDDTLLDEDDRVEDLREDREVGPVGEALDCVLHAVGVDDPDHAEAREAHVGKDVEVLVLPELVEDDEVGPHEQEHVRGVGHAPVQHRVLGDLVGHLKLAGGFHGLDHEAAVREVGGEALGKRGLAGTRGADDQHAPLLARDPFRNDIGLGVVLQGHVHDRADGGDLHAVAEGAACDRDPHRADLDHSDPAFLDFDEPVGVALRPLEDLLRHHPELVLARGLFADLHEFHLADGALLAHRLDPLLEVDRDGVLVEELVDRQRDKIGYLGF